MQTRKTYKAVNPELLYHEIRDLVLKQGVRLEDSDLTTYSSPQDSSAFTSRGTLTFRSQAEGGVARECLRVHIVGSAKDETKVMIDIDEKLFPSEKLAAIQNDLDFIFGSYEAQ